MTHRPYRSNSAHHPKGWWLCCLTVVAVAACLMMARPAAGEDRALEQQVRAAFIVNFVRFIDWPEGALAKGDDPMVVGIIDGDTMAQTLQAAIEGKSIKGHKLVFKRVTAENPKGCQVLFIGAGIEQPGAILKAAGEGPILTIGEGEGFVDAGGVIGFYIEDRKERFEINTAAAERAKLQISSKLLKLAKVVSK